MAKALNTVQPSSYGPIFNITAVKSDIVLDAAAAAGRKVTRVYGYNSSASSDHRFKQCIDFMHYGNTAMRDWLVAYLIRNAKVLGVMGIISNRHCMGFPENELAEADCEVTWRGPSGLWRDYSGPDPHTDHVHVQFNTVAVKGRVKAASKSDKPWRGKLYLTKATKAYNGNGRYVKTYKAGTAFTGTVDKAYAKQVGSTGRYFRVFRMPHRLWLPLDDKNFSHEKGGKAL